MLDHLLPSIVSSCPPLQNWPSCCPLIYHNIAEQIPSWNRSFVRFTYLIELLTIAGFFYNCLIVLIAIFARVGPGLNWWFISMLCLVMGVPLSWWLFYKSVFNSAQTDGGTYSYMKTFLLIMIHMAWAAWMVVAAPNLGTFSAGERQECLGYETDPCTASSLTSSRNTTSIRLLVFCMPVQPNWAVHFVTGGSLIA